MRAALSAEQQRTIAEVSRLIERVEEAERLLREFELAFAGLPVDQARRDKLRKGIRKFLKGGK